MATTIKTKNSVTAAGAPTVLAQGELAVNITDKKMWVGNAATTPVQIVGNGVAGGAGGSTTQVQYNSSGVLAGSANLTFDGTNLTTNNLTIGTTQLGAGNASIMKNRIINGAMVIDQRNAGASVTPVDSSYTLDRWFVRCSQASKFTIQQNAGSVTLPVGFSKYLGVTSTSAYSVASGDFFFNAQAIEGYNIADLGFGTASAKTITISFQVYSSLTGTFGGTLRNGANNRYCPFSYTVSSANTWTTISVTIAGDTTGTWATDNSAGLYVYFNLGTGSTYSGGTSGVWGSTTYFTPAGTVSVVGTNGATFYITGVQLEVGSSATGFEYVNYQTSLANCQRYCYVSSTPATTFAGYGAGTTDIRAAVPVPVNMRASPAPSITSGTSLAWTTAGAKSSTSTTLTLVNNGGNIMVVNLTGFTGISDGYVANLYIAGVLTLSSEL
jgi:hypothetical protein